MGEALTIWSPVVLAELSKVRSFEHLQFYHLDERFQALEDLRIRIREYFVRKQGNALEILFRVEVICLLENMDGKMQLLKREENLRDRVLLQELDRDLNFDKEAQINFIGDIKKISCQGGLEDKQLRVILVIDYKLMVTRQQLIRLFEEETVANNNNYPAESMGQEEALRMEEKNLDLKRQLRFYEQNIASLKRGIKKAESRNAALNMESQQYQSIIAELRRMIEEKEQSRHEQESKFNYEDNRDIGHESIYNEREEGTDNNSLGSRVKRLFLNSI